MTKLLFFLLSVPQLIFANSIPVNSEIKEVTVYLSGAQITRTANLNLKEGTSEIVFTGLSHKIDESSIQVSGLDLVSILSIAYNTNYLEKSKSNPEVEEWKNHIKRLELEVANLNNTIDGLEEEQKVITTNRLVATDNQSLDLEKVKQISTYYRERTTAIKNEIFKTALKVNGLNIEIKSFERKLQETNNEPEKEQGEIKIKFDAPVATNLNIRLSYVVSDAGWVPNYDIKSKAFNAPLKLTYKANVYQKTGQNWTGVKMTLSTESPVSNISKPDLKSHFLNFTSRYAQHSQGAVAKKAGYAYNPNVKKVTGTVTDGSGTPLPGVNVIIKGTTTGTTTDFDGNYSLEVPYGQELEFSCIGFASQEMPLYSSIINLQMQEDANHLEEVVVAGYGTDKSSWSSGAASSVSIGSQIQGRAAGIKVRGMSTSSPVLPLYIIDGMPVEGFIKGDLDINEIQNMEILKGARARSVYGSRGSNGVVVITTKKSDLKTDSSKAQFIIKKPYTVVSDGDLTAVEINSYQLEAKYQYFAAPIVNENVFLTASFKDWEKLNLLPGEASVYFEGTYAGKTAMDPYSTKKEMILSLGIESNILINRIQERNFKSKSFTGSNRILERSYTLEVKNNKTVPVSLKLVDRIPKSQNKEIKVEDVLVYDANYDEEKGLLTWEVLLEPSKIDKKTFSFGVKYPRGRYISL